MHTTRNLPAQSRLVVGAQVVVKGHGMGTIETVGCPTFPGSPAFHVRIEGDREPICFPAEHVVAYADVYEGRHPGFDADEIDHDLCDRDEHLRRRETGEDCPDPLALGDHFAYPSDDQDDAQYRAERRESMSVREILDQDEQRTVIDASIPYDWNSGCNRHAGIPQPWCASCRARADRQGRWVTTT